MTVPAPNPRRVAAVATVVSLLAIPTVLACDRDAGAGASGAPAAGEAPGPTGRPPGTEAAVDRAKKAAKKLGMTLKTQLLARIEAEGAEGAVGFCAENAQALTKQVSRETGVRVGRSALQLRNPANDGPPWVRRRLVAWSGRPASQLSPEVEVVTVDGARRARFVAPIETEGLCLTCHGKTEQIAPSVLERIEAAYPSDMARGYEAGDLRGAVWAEAAIE